MKQLPERLYGLHIGRRLDSTGTERVIARVVCRERGDNGLASHPLNCRGGGEWGADKFFSSLAFDGLGLYGFVSETSTSGEVIGLDPEYRDVFAIDERLARKMAKTLKLVTDRIEKHRSTEAGDVLASVAAALHLTFVVEQAGKSFGSSYSDSEWRWMSIAEGRNRFRDMIKAAEADCRARKAA